MLPVRFVCREMLPEPPEAIAATILDLSQWPRFTGYGPLPGIRSAEFEVRTPEVVGTRIRVISTDGSTHVEEIVEWRPAERIVQRMSGFSPPLSTLATEFVETWEFERGAAGTKVTRTFELHPRSNWVRPAVWLISVLLKHAVKRSLRDMHDLRK